MREIHSMNICSLLMQVPERIMSFKIATLVTCHILCEKSLLVDHDRTTMDRLWLGATQVSIALAMVKSLFMMANIKLVVGFPTRMSD